MSETNPPSFARALCRRRSCGRSPLSGTHRRLAQQFRIGHGLRLPASAYLIDLQGFRVMRSIACAETWPWYHRTRRPRDHPSAVTKFSSNGGVPRDSIALSRASYAMRGKPSWLIKVERERGRVG